MPHKTFHFDADVLNIIRKMEWSSDGLIAYRYPWQLEISLYQRVNKALVALGGHWDRSANGYVFNKDPRDSILDLVHTGEITVEKDGFYETPRAIVEFMLKTVRIPGYGLILEPSAGRAAIADVLVANGVSKTRMVLVEKNVERAEYLISKGYKVYNQDFMKFTLDGFSSCIMNPPFELEQDTQHILHAYDLLAPGGRLVSVAKKGIIERTGHKAGNFHAWMAMVNAGIVELPPKSFHDSGTDVGTELVVMRNKPPGIPQAPTPSNGHVRKGKNGRIDISPAVADDTLETMQQHGLVDPGTSDHNNGRGGVLSLKDELQVMADQEALVADDAPAKKNGKARNSKKSPVDDTSAAIYGGMSSRSVTPKLVTTFESIARAGQPWSYYYDWLKLAEATLAAMPSLAKYAAEHQTLQGHQDTSETQALFAMLRQRYPPDSRHFVWDGFQKAFSLVCYEASLPVIEGDFIGDTYMLLNAGSHHLGQYFTPWTVCECMARMAILDGEKEVWDRLKSAVLKDDLASAMMFALYAVTAGQEDSGEKLPDEFMHEKIMRFVVHPALASGKYKPITICDPCVGSGAMLLAAANQFPKWMIDAGLIQFYGMDIDEQCVRMARVNSMLYGLNGFHTYCLLDLKPDQIRQVAAISPYYGEQYEKAADAIEQNDIESVQEVQEEITQMRTPDESQLLVDRKGQGALSAHQGMLFDTSEYKAPRKRHKH